MAASLRTLAWINKSDHDGSSPQIQCQHGGKALLKPRHLEGLEGSPAVTNPHEYLVFGLELLMLPFSIIENLTRDFGNHLTQNDSNNRISRKRLISRSVRFRFAEDSSYKLESASLSNKSTIRLEF